MRQSNIELCRIVSIILVLLVHSAFAANGYPKELNSSSLWLIILESISIIGVNVFIFISGYFSIKLKPKTIYTIVLTVAFYFILLTGISLAMGKPIQGKNLLFISNSHYFIIDYLGLALLSPILNKFADNSSKKVLLTTLSVLIAYQTYFGCITEAASTEFDAGYSLMSFAIIYMLARYIRIYNVPSIFERYSGIMYLACTFSLIVASIILLKFGYSGALHRVYAYNNPIVIVSAIFFFLFFKKMNIGNNKYINHIAKSTLGILLFHASTPAVPSVWAFMKKTFTHLADNLNFVNIFYWGGCIIAIALAAIVVDQIRIYIIDRIFKTTNK